MRLGVYGVYLIFFLSLLTPMALAQPVDSQVNSGQVAGAELEVTEATTGTPSVENGVDSASKEKASLTSEGKADSSTEVSEGEVAENDAGKVAGASGGGEATKDEVAKAKSSESDGEQAGETYWNPKVEASWAPESSFLEKFANTLLALVVVGGLAWGGTFFLVKGVRQSGFLAWLSGKKIAGGEASAYEVEILSRQNLSVGQEILSLRVGTEILVVGVTQGQMSVLTKLEVSSLEEGALPDDKELASEGTPKDMRAEVLKNYLSVLPGVGGRDAKG